MLDHQGGLAHETVFQNDESRDTDTRVEIQVMKRQGALEDVPHGLLGIEQIEV